MGAGEIRAKNQRDSFFSPQAEEKEEGLRCRQHEGIRWGGVRVDPRRGRGKSLLWGDRSCRRH